MRKFIGWAVVLLIVAGLLFLAYREMTEKRKNAETAQRMLYINQLQAEIRDNLALVQMALTDRENMEDSDTMTIEVKELKKFMIIAGDVYRFGPQAKERFTELKKRAEMKGFLDVDGFQAEMKPKDAADVQDMFINLQWLLNKAAAKDYEFVF